MKIIGSFLQDENAATAIESGLIAAGISPAIIAAMNGLGPKPATEFPPINRSLT